MDTGKSKRIEKTKERGLKMNITFIKKRNSAELKLSKKFYPKETVDTVIEKFKGIKIVKKEEKEYFHISMKSRGLPCDKASLEFCNLLLSELRGSAV